MNDKSNAAGLSKHGRAFIAAVSLGGLAIAAWCAWTIVHTPPPPAWLVFAGLTLASACDFVLASDRAEFGFPEVRLGVPTIVGAIRMPAKVGWQLVVAEPAAERDIDTTRIALSRTPNVIEYFADGNWSDTAPKMVQAKLIEAFESTNAIVAVGRELALTHAVVQVVRDLAGDARRMQAEALRPELAQHDRPDALRLVGRRVEHVGEVVTDPVRQATAGPEVVLAQDHRGRVEQTIASGLQQRVAGGLVVEGARGVLRVN